MGVTMFRRVRTRLAFAFAAAVPMAAISMPADAAGLPQVELTTKNKVPACATPGRLMGFLESRNRNLDPRFEAIAADYMRIGNELKIRWDIAFFQMMLETGNLTFKGDVSSKQNNFAGMGATGNHVPGESFPDVATGVKAHLQHLLMYAGEHIDNPVAERTRKVQEWGVLTDWQKSIGGPVNYDQLAKQWAPTSRRYSRDIAALAEAFYGTPCKGEDPKPELMALAMPGAGASKTVAAAASDQPTADLTQTASAGDASGDTGTYISGLRNAPSKRRGNLGAPDGQVSVPNRSFRRRTILPLLASPHRRLLRRRHSRSSTRLRRLLMRRRPLRQRRLPTRLRAKHRSRRRRAKNLRPLRATRRSLR